MHNGEVPAPVSVLLFGCGLLDLIGLAGRKLFHGTGNTSYNSATIARWCLSEISDGLLLADTVEKL